MKVRRALQLTQAELKTLLEATRPMPYMVVGGYPPISQQTRANDAWRALGRKRGFDWETVRPVAGEDQTWFSAEVEVEDDTASATGPKEGA